MDVFTSPEVLEKVSKSAVGKATDPVGKLFLLAILAGAYIAFGAQGSLMASFNLTANAATVGLGKVVMGVVFPIGLMLVVICGAELFTGNCLMVAGALDKRIKWTGILRNWAIVYIGNMVGSLLIVAMISASGLLDTGAGMLGAATVKVAVSKTSLSFGRAFILGIMCNWLVCLAVWVATAGRELVSKIVGIWFVIFLFVLSGFEHSVANMYFIPAGLIAAMNPEYVSLAGVDVSGLTLDAFAIGNLLPVTLGNIVGGGLFVAVMYWIIHRKFIQ